MSLRNVIFYGAVLLFSQTAVEAMRVFTACDSVRHTRQKSYSSPANQDCVNVYSLRPLLQREPVCTLVSVCDGYGDLGEHIAAKVDASLAAVFSSFVPLFQSRAEVGDYEEAVKRAYAEAREQVAFYIDEQLGDVEHTVAQRVGGSTSTGALIMPHGIVILHNVGDSRTACFAGSHLLKSTVEHKADAQCCPQEVLRVLRAGGCIKQRWVDLAGDFGCYYEEHIVERDGDGEWLTRWVRFDEEALEGCAVADEEFERIARCVEEGTLQPRGMRLEHLLMTRVLGECRHFRDRFMRREIPIVSCEPDVTVLRLESNPEGHTVISGSDGFWDMIKYEDIAESIERLRGLDGKRFARNLCSHLIMLAKQRSRQECNSRIHDDISVAVAYIR